MLELLDVAPMSRQTRRAERKRQARERLQAMRGGPWMDAYLATSPKFRRLCEREAVRIAQQLRRVDRRRLAPRGIGWLATFHRGAR